MVDEVKDVKVEEKRDSKKLDDLKKSDENKKAVAESEGKVAEKKTEGKGENLATDSEDDTDSQEKENVKQDEKASEPTVAKTPKAVINNNVPSKKETKVSSLLGKKSKKKNEPVVELEREYIVPMRKGFLNVPHYRRAKKAVKTLKEFMVRHMNVRDGDMRKVKIDINLNNEIWFRGIKKPMNKIRVKAKKVDDVVYVELADVPDVVKFKMAREAKAKAAAVVDKKGKKKAEKAKDKDKDKDGVDDKKEEGEDKKAGSEKAVKDAKVEVKGVKHTATGKHAAKTMPVRKVLK